MYLIIVVYIPNVNKKHLLECTLSLIHIWGVESDYEIRIYRNRSLKGSRRNLASFCNLSIWKSQ